MAPISFAARWMAAMKNYIMHASVNGRVGDQGRIVMNVINFVLHIILQQSYLLLWQNLQLGQCQRQVQKMNLHLLLPTTLQLCQRHLHWLKRSDDDLEEVKVSVIIVFHTWIHVFNEFISCESTYSSLLHCILVILCMNSFILWIHIIFRFFLINEFIYSLYHS